MAALDWSDVRVFLALHKHGRMVEAARVLGVNATTILRRLAALEAALGCPVFHRASTLWVATAAGTRMVPIALEMERNAASLERAAAAEVATVRGLVRISAPEALASEFVVPLLLKLRAQFPQVAIELGATNQLASLSRREADLAIRLNRPEDKAVVARRLVNVASAIAASRSYLATRGASSWADHDFILGPGALEARWLSSHAPHANVVLRSESTHARFAAVRAGLGLSFLPRYLIDSTAELQAIETLPSRGLWLVIHREAKRQVSVRAVGDALGRLIIDNRRTVER